MTKKLIKGYAAKMGKGVTGSEAEAEILRVIASVVRILAPKFRFGYYTNQDMEQEGTLAAIEVLNEGSYDVSRPLENFIYAHVHNSLYNLRRKHYLRLEVPCKCCDPNNLPAYPCKKWRDWSARNTTKQNIMKPLDMSNVSDESENNMREESSVIDDTIGSELRTLLDREIPVDLRKDYLQMLDGKRIPKGRREKVREAVLIIIKDKGYAEEEA